MCYHAKKRCGAFISIQNINKWVIIVIAMNKKCDCYEIIILRNTFVIDKD